MRMCKDKEMKKVKFILSILLFIMLMPFMVNAESKYLYDVLKNESESGGLAREYTGEHYDSFTEEPSHKIYHWYAENDEEGNQVIEKNNVIFANHCWQMIRTTDTGGVKLIYNGEVNENKCLDDRPSHVGYKTSEIQNMSGSYWYGDDFEFDSESNTFELKGTKIELIWNDSNKEKLVGKYTCKSQDKNGKCAELYFVTKYSDNQNAYIITLSSNIHYSQIGKLAFNEERNSETYLGYKYGKVYPIKSKIISGYNFNALEVRSISTDYWYGTSVSKINNSNTYTMYNKFKIQNSNDYSRLVGTYTFFNSNQNYQGSNAYYIVAIDYNNMYYYELDKSTKPNLFEPDSYTYGDNYTLSDNGNITINNPNTIYRKDYYINYQNLKNKYLCINDLFTSSPCKTVYYIYETNKSYFSAQKLSDIYKFSNNYTYENGKYKLHGNIIELKETTSPNSLDLLDKNRYTCLNNETECETLSYVVGSRDSSLYYVELDNGKSLENLYNDMNLNTNNSVIKSGIDEWYKKNLISYSKSLEDTIYCNDKSNKSISSIADEFYKIYSTQNYTNLNCINNSDQFSLSNENAKLEYPVGLITFSEMNLVNNSTIRKTNNNYWLMSPKNMNYWGVRNNMITSQGEFDQYSLVNSNSGVRPAISLKKNIKYVSGIGSKEDPYLIPDKHNISIETKNETEDLNIELNDMTQVEYEEKVNFKVTPIKGFKVNSIKIVDEENNEIDYQETDNKNEYTFVMPASDVTIIPSYVRVKNSVNVDNNKNTKEIIIEVNDVSAVVYEDKVKFTVTPEEGYEVDKIEIIDKEGNKIEYRKTSKDNEYEFTMPDTDVIITPSYRKIESINVPNTLKNPNTGDKLYIIILLLIAGLGMGTVIYKKDII